MTDYSKFFKPTAGLESSEELSECEAGRNAAQAAEAAHRRFGPGTNDPAVDADKTSEVKNPNAPNTA